MNKVIRYRGHRIVFNEVNNLWWYKIREDDGIVEYPANTLNKAKYKIDRHRRGVSKLRNDL